MTNNELIIYLKQLFDRFEVTKFTYTKRESNGQFSVLQKRDRLISAEVVQLPFNWIHYAVITPKQLVNIKNQLTSLYNYTFVRGYDKDTLYIDISLINNGFSYKVINCTKQNKVIDKGKIVFKSTPSFIYYFIYLLSKN
jgi:hypothetical protein